MFASGEKTVNQRKHNIVYKHVVRGQGSKGLIFRASDTVGRKKKTGFLGTNSRKNRPISREFSAQTLPKSNR